ncbi:hypothetical protein [Azospirillum sp. B2RO_4]|uniref:hypothetical protein n=1 Tax=Azospirillum sp. B2RO_4 TaxID=3027796 RepID=UPI003DA8935E
MKRQRPTGAVGGWSMSKNPPIIKIEQATQFLIDKKVTFPPCPLCGCSKFSWYSTKEDNVLFIEKNIIITDSGEQADEYKPVATSFCDNCGYSIDFDGLVMLAWKRMQKNGGADE